MGIYVRTRGRDRDYQFFGASPAKFWWRDYNTVTDIEKPTILLESDSERWRAYVAGIASQRRDMSDREIQFNLVLEGDCGDGAAGALALDVVRVSVADLARQPDLPISGDRLDACLSEDEVERLLTVSGESASEEAAEAVRTAYKDVPAEAAPDEALLGWDSWIAGIADARARHLFIAQAGRLLIGQPGCALVLNRFLDVQYVDRLPRWPGSLGVLLARPEQLRRELGELRGKAAPPEEPLPGTVPRRRRRKPRQGVMRPRNLALGLIGLLIAIALIIWLTRSSSPSRPAPHPSPTSSHKPSPSA